MIEVRTITEAEIDAWQVHLDTAFGGDPDPEDIAAWRPLVDTERAHGVFDGPLLVGTAGIFTFDMTVPGGPQPCAGVTAVSVSPTHRRQGLLTSMMRTQLDEIRDRGREAFASLWASEASIYARFGYGVASRRWSLTIKAHDPQLLGRPSRGTVRLVERDELRTIAGPLYDAMRADRTGMISRSSVRWTTRLLDLPANRHGASARKHAVYEVDGEPRGYVLYRTKSEWTAFRPEGQVRVQELVYLDPDAHAGLWRFVLGVDLMRSVLADNIPGDDPVVHRLRDPRVVDVGIVDGLHVRMIDVPRALTTRSYAASGSVTIEVVDPLGYAAGRWTLDASPDGATCEPTTASPDLTLGAEELGGVYLGDTTLRSLYLAGRVDEHTPGAADRASVLFAWPRAAWCPEIF
ncbi:MAG TPA: GNAT family N-acetyltransferase [Frankiaceae bacterium]|nr:GNAT family N-acetyltransferase [Frankiaceae bacterium]